MMRSLVLLVMCACATMRLSEAMTCARCSDNDIKACPKLKSGCEHIYKDCDCCPKCALDWKDFCDSLTERCKKGLTCVTEEQNKVTWSKTPIMPGKCGKVSVHYNKPMDAGMLTLWKRRWQRIRVSALRFRKRMLKLIKKLNLEKKACCNKRKNV